MEVTIRPLTESDLDEADRIFRTAFGTFLGLPDPMSFTGDADLIRTRWRGDPEGALAAELDGKLVGSNFAARWGSFGFFGPLSVRPELWDKGIARRLLDSTMQLFERWGTRHTALFTFSQSAKHVALYQKYGFWPRFLTVIFSRPINRRPKAGEWTRFSQAPDAGRCLAECLAVCEAVYPGLDLRREIASVASQRLGDTVLVREGSALAGFAVCHVGPGSEGGSGTGFVKFGAVRPGPRAAERFRRLVEACEEFAAGEGAAQHVVGTNTARHGAYRVLIELGYRTFFQGVAMQRPNEPGYNTPEQFVIDDWR